MKYIKENHYFDEINEIEINQSLIFTFVNDPIEIKKIGDLLNIVEQDLYKTLGDENGKVN